MKRKILISSIGVLLAAALLAGFVWWYRPMYFLKDVTPSQVARIEVFNGSSGQRFAVESREEIDYIVTNIQSTKMYKEEWERTDGFVYSLSFFGTDGVRIDHFALNGNGSIRRDNMEYEAEFDSLCFGYIKELEQAQRNRPTQ